MAKVIAPNHTNPPAVATLAAFGVFAKTHIRAPVPRKATTPQKRPDERKTFANHYIYQNTCLVVKKNLWVTGGVLTAALKNENTAWCQRL